MILQAVISDVFSLVAVLVVRSLHDFEASQINVEVSEPAIASPVVRRALELYLDEVFAVFTAFHWISLTVMTPEPSATNS